MAACGPASDQVTVTLLTPFGKGRAFHELSRSFFSSGVQEVSLLNTTYCLEDQIVVGVNNGVGGTQFITKKVRLKLQSIPIPPNCTSNNPAGCLSNYSYLEEPIEIPVPKGMTVEVGLTGPAYNPVDFDSDGICDPILSTNTYANESVSLVGHQTINISENSVISLPIWVTEPYQASLPTILFGNANNDFLKISVNAQHALKSIDYLKDSITQVFVHHELDTFFSSIPNDTSTGSLFYTFIVPRIFPFTLNFSNNTSYTFQNINSTYSYIDQTQNPPITVIASLISF